MNYVKNVRGLKMMLVEQLKDDLQKRKRAFWDWHNANPQVYEKFEEYTLEAIATGRKHYSHWAIIHLSVHKTVVATLPFFYYPQLVF